MDACASTDVAHSTGGETHEDLRPARPVPILGR